MTDESRLYEGAIGERLLEITILSHLRVNRLRCKSHFLPTELCLKGQAEAT